MISTAPAFLSGRCWFLPFHEEAEDVGSLVALLGMAVVIVLSVDPTPWVEYVPEEATAMVEDTIPDAPSAYGIPLSGFLVERGRLVQGPPSAIS